jgi:hypothetical protein
VSPPSKISTNVVNDNRFLAGPHGAKLGASALGADAVGVRDLVLNGIRFHARRTELSILASLCGSAAFSEEMLLEMVDIAPAGRILLSDAA